MTNEKAIKMLEYIKLVGNGESEYKNDAQAIAIDMAIKALEQQPTRPTARWERLVDDFKKCSKCGKPVKFYRNYKHCPGCGARMIESEEER